MTAWMVLWQLPGTPARAAADELGRLLAFATSEAALLYALLYAALLGERGLIAMAQERHAQDVTDLLMAHGADPETAAERLVMVEAQTTSEADLAACHLGGVDPPAPPRPPSRSPPPPCPPVSGGQSPPPTRSHGCPTATAGVTAPSTTGAMTCSGRVSYVLHAAHVLGRPRDSSELMSWGRPGRGHWLTVYANAGHAFMVINGRRFDTSGARSSRSRWHRARRSRAGYVARHPPHPRAPGACGPWPTSARPSSTATTAA